MSTVIVGAGPGLGAALAKRFGRNQERVAVITRSTSTTERLLADAGKAGMEMRAFTGDGGNEASLATALEKAITWAGEPKVFIYNAAAFNDESAHTLGAKALRDNLEVTLLGAVQSVQAVLPGMIERGAGTILITGGGLALNPVAGWTALATSKAALRAYAYSLNKAVADKGVHAATVTICGVIEPDGLFDPDRIAESYWELHTQPKGSFSPEIVYQPEGAELNYNEPG